MKKREGGGERQKEGDGEIDSGREGEGGERKGGRWSEEEEWEGVKTAGRRREVGVGRRE